MWIPYISRGRGRMKIDLNAIEKTLVIFFFRSTCLMCLCNIKETQLLLQI